MAEDVVISVKGLVKEYELYDKNIDQLKEIFSIRRKKYHRDFKALDNINFEVLRGEHLVILSQPMRLYNSLYEACFFG
jgi:ABC-type polysaccharide/polyol phosphate transport system ATPase subunit